eukprot:m.294389 g.294389  ORF g.294389 m.294389 type:complete len:242 (+) comp55137_c0_seq4:112-837(+)
MLPLLLETGGVDVNAQDGMGKTALVLAVHEGRVADARALLAAGADVSLRDHTGNTILHFGAWRCLPEMLEVLLNWSTADINTQDEDGNTPLMLTMDSDWRRRRAAVRQACIELFLQHGALLHIANHEGKTARSLAEEFHLFSIFHLLQEHENYLANLGQHTKPALRTPPTDSSGPLEETNEAMLVVSSALVDPQVSSQSLEDLLTEHPSDQEPLRWPDIPLPVSDVLLLSFVNVCLVIFFF